MPFAALTSLFGRFEYVAVSAFPFFLGIAGSFSGAGLRRRSGLGDEVAELVPPGYAELGVGAVQVGGDGARGQEQPVGDLPVAVAAGRQVDDLALLRGQLPQSVGCRRCPRDGYPPCR